MPLTLGLPKEMSTSFYHFSITFLFILFFVACFILTFIKALPFSGTLNLQIIFLTSYIHAPNPNTSHLTSNLSKYIKTSPVV